MIVLPNLIGHRGIAGIAPENTLAGFKKARELELGWVECDVQLAANDVPVVIHDETVDRTTTATGKVAEKTADELQELGVPTLADVITCCRQYDLGLNVELKLYVAKPFNLVNAVKQVLPDSDHKLLLSSFDLQILCECRDQMPELERGYLIGRWQKNWLEAIHQCGARALHVAQNQLDPQRVGEVKAKGKLLLAYTVNDPKRAKDLLEWGVDALFVDYPKYDIFRAAKDVP